MVIFMKISDMKMYLLSSDNGCHANTAVMFTSIEETVVHFVNERIEEYNYGWEEVFIKEIQRPLPNIPSYIEVHLVAVESDGYEAMQTVYISEMTLVKPENKYGVIQL